MKQLVSLVTAATVTLAATGGCSLVFVKGPGQTGNPPAYYPQDCTESMVWPVVDGAIAALNVLFAAVPDNNNSCSTFDGSSCSSSDRSARLATGLISAAIFAASAVYGYTRVSSCSDARARYSSAHPEAPFGPVMPYGYPAPYGYPQQPQPPYGYPQQPQQPPYGYPQQPQANPAGTEGQACIAPSNTCNAGLVCASQLCVRDPNAGLPPTGAPGAPGAP